MATREHARMLRPVAALLAVVALVLAATGLAGAEKPVKPDKGAAVSVVTLSGGPVTITEPGTVYDVALGPASAVTFTQQPGEVVTATMQAAFEVEDGGTIFCDVHGAVNLLREEDPTYDPTYTAMRQNWIAQRGDVWWEMYEMGRDSSRSLPSPATPTEYSVVAVAWMDDVPVTSDQDCYGTQYGFEYQDFDVSVRVSLVTTRG